MSIRIWSSLLIYATCLVCFSQSFQNEIAFVRHLETRQDYEEGLLYLDLLSNRYDTSSQKDTLSFFKGRIHYAQKDLGLSVSAFEAVSDSDLFLWNYSRFYSSLQLAYLNEYDRSLALLKDLKSLSHQKYQLQQIEVAGLHLLKRDITSFTNVSKTFDGDYYELKRHQDELVEMGAKIANYKKRSPLLAGVLSGLVPGAGKIYVGKIGQGTMALVTTGVFALQAYEGYRKDGPDSPRFIIFGSIFSAFYVANIWGSVIAAKIQYREFNDTVDETILVNMHIPLRNLYR